MTQRIPHTPGPWTTQIGMIRQESTRRAIALVSGHPDAKDRAANALLISKAPEMLELLEETEFLAQSLEAMDVEFKTPDAFNLFNKIRALVTSLHEPEES